MSLSGPDWRFGSSVVGAQRERVAQSNEQQCGKQAQQENQSTGIVWTWSGF